MAYTSTPRYHGTVDSTPERPTHYGEQPTEEELRAMRAQARERVGLEEGDHGTV